MILLGLLSVYLINHFTEENIMSENDDIPSVAK